MNRILKLLGIDTGVQETELKNPLDAQALSGTVGFIAIADRVRRTTQIYLHAPGEHGLMGLHDARSRFYADGTLDWDSYGVTWQAYTLPPLEQMGAEGSDTPLAAREQVIRVKTGRRVMRRAAIV